MTATPRPEPCPFCTICTLCTLCTFHPSSQFQGGERDERQQERNNPEPHNDLGFGDPVEFVMMVDRCHAKDPPPGGLVREDLKEDRDRLNAEHPSADHEEQLMLGQHRQ